MVVLRLTRIGKKKQAQYRVVVADSRRSVSSKFIAIVGWYNPHTKEVELKKDEITAWMAKGAQPSNSLAKILKANGIKLPDWVQITQKNKKPKKEVVAKPEKAKENVILNDVKDPGSEVLDSSVEPQNDEVPETPAEEITPEEVQEEIAEEIETTAEEAEENTEKNPE